MPRRPRLRSSGHAWASGAQRVLSGTFEGNERSRCVLEKLGFRVSGRSTRHNLARGLDVPHVDMAMERPLGLDPIADHDTGR